MRTYKTQMEAAKRGIVTPEMELVAKKEYMEPETLRQLVAKGEVAIPCNIHHTSISPEGIGGGLRTKINVNLGISGDCNRYDMEMQKVDLALQFGAEAIMDLSNYGKTNTFRRELIAKSPAMIGTVPMYDAIGYLEKDLLEITPEDFLRVVRAHAEEGVDFMTIHAGINRRAVEAFMRDKRRMNIVSRGGSLLFAWMMMTGRENPFYEHYDEVLEILREYDVTISLGDALRPGCIDDSTDAGQVAELIELGSLTERAWAKDVQVMVEGPGHMAMNEIAANMQLQKRLCHNAPFYVLGPIVTDIAPGYDHITAAIGGAIARELYEETGIRAREEAFLLLESDRGEEAFFDFYFLRCPPPQPDIVLQPGETSDAKWVTLDEVREMARAGLLAAPIARRFRLQEARLERLVETDAP